MSGESRRAHSASGSYALPNDSPEHKRLDWQSRALTKMMGGQDFLTDVSALAQKTPIFRAIEVGPGTGLRTAALASLAPPSAEVYGVDISPVPALYTQPSNVDFIQADIIDVPTMKDARFQLGKFDFITHRMLVAGLNLKEYARVCFDLLRPGGRVEFQDTSLRWFDAHDNEISQDYAWLRVFNKASEILHLDSLGPEKLPQWLRDCGFVDVDVKQYQWLTSEEDDEEIAKYTTQVLNAKMFPVLVRKTVERAGLVDLQGLGSLDEVVEDFRRTVTGVPKGTHTKFHVTTGRKP